MSAQHRYLAASWQGLLQYLVMLVSRGYVLYHVVRLPGRKADRWPDIDRKLIEKYRANLSRSARYRRRGGGQSVAAYCRVQGSGWAVVLRTEGETPDTWDDKFTDIREKPLPVPVGPHMVLEICFLRGKPTVRMSPETYEAIKVRLTDLMRHGKRREALEVYDHLNGLPAYKGVIRQKVSLARHLVREGRRTGHRVRWKELRIRTRRQVVQVWADDEGGENSGGAGTTGTAGSTGAGATGTDH